MFADSPISVEDDEAFIAGLEPGESETVAFSLGAGGNALAKDYPVSIDFQYDESDGDTKLSRTYELPVSVEASGGDRSLSLPLVGAGLLVLAAGGGYLYRRYG